LNKKLSLIFFVALITLISAGLVYSNFKPSWQLEKSSITIAVSKSPLSTPFYVAKSINAFKGTCVNVEYDEVLGGQIAFAKVMSGEADFGTSSDSVLAFNSLTKQLFVTHAMFVESDNDVKLLTRTVDKIRSVIDLKGKKIGVTKGTASEYFLSTLLAIEGLTIEDVELRHYQPNKLIDGFVSNEVDAIVPWEPFAFNAIQSLGEKITILDTKNLNTLSFNLISQKPDNQLVAKAKCVIEGLNIAMDYIASEPEISKNIVMDELKLSPLFIDWVWTDYIFKLGLNQSLILNIKSQAAWAIKTQMADYQDIPNVDVLLDSRAMLLVDPGAVNIPL
jgi:ABC-type nitrate/sulfonate/bicarbonate transport system substrate-binding protein